MPKSKPLFKKDASPLIFKWLLIFVLAVIATVGMISWLNRYQVLSLFAPSSPHDFSSARLLRQYQDHQQIPVRGGDRQLTVEVVTTPASRSQGLSDRDGIGSDGMLFVFPDSANHSFWMKDMRFDLDFIWLKDGEVKDLTLAVPKPIPTEPLWALRRYSPRVPVNQVLEVNRGKVQEWGITVGQRFVLP